MSDSTMQIQFTGGKRVHSVYKGFTVATDQPVSEGGDGTAPEPFDLFISSLGTCAGVYIVYFCQSRGIATEGISMTLEMHRDTKTNTLAAIDIKIILPEGFPTKYRNAVVKAAQMCTVKRMLSNPPDIRVHTAST